MHIRHMNFNFTSLIGAKKITKNKEFFIENLLSKLCNFLSRILYLYVNLLHTRVCGITGSASARRWGGYGFNSRPKPRQS